MNSIYTGPLKTTGVPQTKVDADKVERLVRNSALASSGAIREGCTIHYLKSVEPWFAAMHRGSKRHEIRFDDRHFKAGDVLAQQQYIEVSQGVYDYSGQWDLVFVRYIMGHLEHPGITEGYVVMSVDLFGAHNTFEE